MREQRTIEQMEKGWAESGRALSDLEFSFTEGFEMPSDRVLLSLDENKASSTLWMPPRDSVIGTVVALGRNPLTNAGIPIEREISVGDRVIVLPAQGVAVKWNGASALLLRETEVLAVLGTEEGEEGLDACGL